MLNVNITDNLRFLSFILSPINITDAAFAAFVSFALRTPSGLLKQPLCFGRPAVALRSPLRAQSALNESLVQCWGQGGLWAIVAAVADGAVAPFVGDTPTGFACGAPMYAQEHLLSCAEIGRVSLTLSLIK
ncbi:MAG: hypothetical protein HC862_21985 [Scytonema sp. RU_4_4]|nr:hypothetical protein [Scytonema sp. RU_4_4]